MAEQEIMIGPRGPKPRKTFSRRNIFLYGTLAFIAVYYAIPLYVMTVTSLKGMPEIRLGNIFSPPLEVTFAPWVKAWSQACTGLTCEGLSRGFWNSVQITVPSVIASIIVASINGYALANWRFKGANVFFTILIFGAFIPYQVMLYPLVIMLREIGIYGSLGGLVIVHTIFGMPILTLLFVRWRFVAIANAVTIGVSITRVCSCFERWIVNTSIGFKIVDQSVTVNIVV